MEYSDAGAVNSDSDQVRSSSGKLVSDRSTWSSGRANLSNRTFGPDTGSLLSLLAALSKREIIRPSSGGFRCGRWSRIVGVAGRADMTDGRFVAVAAIPAGHASVESEAASVNEIHIGGIPATELDLELIWPNGLVESVHLPGKGKWLIREWSGRGFQ